MEALPRICTTYRTVLIVSSCCKVGSLEVGTGLKDDSVAIRHGKRVRTRILTNPLPGLGWADALRARVIVADRARATASSPPNAGNGKLGGRSPVHPHACQHTIHCLA